MPGSAPSCVLNGRVPLVARASNTRPLAQSESQVLRSGSAARSHSVRATITRMRSGTSSFGPFFPLRIPPRDHCSSFFTRLPLWSLDARRAPVAPHAIRKTKQTPDTDLQERKVNYRRDTNGRTLTSAVVSPAARRTAPAIVTFCGQASVFFRTLDGPRTSSEKVSFSPSVEHVSDA